MIDRWARLASVAPRLVNAVQHAPGIRELVRAALHLAPEREIPRFAPSTFRQWARRRNVPDTSNRSRSDTPEKQVILWADTFNNYFHPKTSQAAYEVLHAAGFEVSVPARHYCCGRPLYDFGMIDRARSYLQSILRDLAAPIDAGVPIVVLEPSCASVFRDELRNLFPADERAARLRQQTFLLSEFLERKAPDYALPKLNRKVLVQHHCHHKAILKTTDEESLLRKIGVNVHAPDAGCCGMAGPFGFEKTKYAVSQAIGERVLLPAVREADADTLVLANGFSCQEQILQGTGRRALHLAELLWMAQRNRDGDS
jgi:Fe-S oxidoreductase